MHALLYRRIPFLRLLPRWVLLGSVFLMTSAATAQPLDVRRVTLEEALDLFAQNNLELLLARSRSTEMTALAWQASAHPNPSAIVTHEPLWREGESYSETYVNLSQRIEWPGLRKARVGAARQLAEAAEANLQADSLRLAYEVAKAYTEAAAAEERTVVLDAVTNLFRRADQSSQAMLVEGEVSGFSLRRLRVERARYENRLALSELDVLNARRHLTLLVLPESDDMLVAPAQAEQGISPQLTLETVMVRAQARRAELRSTRAEVASAQARVQQARKERLPEPTVTAGYKQQSDGYSGVFLGLAAPLPVFDRNRGAIEVRQARLHAAETRFLLAERQIENDVRRAYDRYNSLVEQLGLIAGELLSEADALLHAARIGYAEGEMSLIELLDAAEAYRDARISTIDLQAGLQIAYYDLLRASGGSSFE
jgi:cobalt-zinc-cadmium efflux system outer membrane protein